ncbi:MAG: hypothetical protein JWQ84_1934 [Mucilaginibacter sp.]|nr:hypothetical protein [Mucilaginibacter sp.]
MVSSDCGPQSVAVRLYFYILPDLSERFSFTLPDPFFQVSAVKV